MALLEVQNLEVKFATEDGLVSAVNGISFELERGETLALVGESGSGKSVTSMSIMRLLPENITRYSKDSKIIFDGVSILDAPLDQLRKLRGKRLGMIFQEPMTSLNPYLTIGSQLIEAAITHDSSISKQTAEKNAVELLTKVGIREPERRLRQYPHEFSGGQLQRIMIAMALTNKPDLLIADEPTTALDVTIQAEILDLLRALQAEMGMAIIFITHDLGLAEHYSDKVCVMRQGEIVERGEIKQVFNSPAHEYTVELINSTPKGMKEPVPADAKVILDAQDVKVNFVLETSWFGKPKKVFEAVKGISIQVKEGETLGIVGESGSGKSTLGKAIMQMLPYAGKISFDGKDLGSLSKAEARALKAKRQIVFQDPYGSLSPRLTIGDIIAEPLTVHEPNLSKAERTERVMAMLDEVAMPRSAINRYPHEFSGGQRQRIAIARAMILNPKFVLLDEPTSALDRSVQVKVVELLRNLQKKYGLTYLFISHDLAIVRAMSNNVIVMQQGEVVEYGDAEQIFHNPQQEYTKKLLDATFNL